jgi:hypothetical protein
MATDTEREALVAALRARRAARGMADPLNRLIAYNAAHASEAVAAVEAPVSDNLASALSRQVAWLGHITDASAAAWLAETHPREDCAYIIARAIALGLIREVPRLGGYVATRAGNEREFGRLFADFADA